MCEEGAASTAAPSGPCCGDCEPKQYRIVRFFKNPNRPAIRRRGRLAHLTLAEAQQHCGRDDTRSEGYWFDGYEEAS